MSNKNREDEVLVDPFAPPKRATENSTFADNKSYNFNYKNESKELQTSSFKKLLDSLDQYK